MTQKNEARIFRGYHLVIHEATGRTDLNELSAIEDCMRHEIFHSTLDWQTRDVLIAGARLAEQVLIEMREIPKAVILPQLPKPRLTLSSQRGLAS